MIVARGLGAPRTGSVAAAGLTVFVAVLIIPGVLCLSITAADVRLSLARC